MTKQGLCWEMMASCFGISDKVGDLFATSCWVFGFIKLRRHDMDTKVFFPKMEKHDTMRTCYKIMCSFLLYSG